MENWYVFSTKDIINSTNHVQILSYDDIEQANDRVLASFTVNKDGKILNTTLFPNLQG